MGCPTVPFLSNQKQLFVAIQTSDIDSPCRSDAHATARASILATAGLFGSNTNEACSTVGACARDLEACELVAIQQNISQVILQNHFQKLVAGACDRPAVLVVVVNDQTVGEGCIPELSVVVGVASGTILNAVNMVVIVYHFMQKGGCHFFDGSGKCACADVDFVGASHFGNPGIFSQGEMAIGFWGGLDGDGRS